MISRYIPKIVVITIVAFVGWHVYAYFFDTTKPCIIVHGIHENEYHYADVQCCVQSDKSGIISLWLDNQPLASNFKMKANDDGHIFTVPTKTLSNGKHTLKVDFTDNSYHKNTMLLNREFYVDNQPLQAVMLKTGAANKVFQGRTLHVQFQTNKPVKKSLISILSCKYECFPEAQNSNVYECFIPIACEELPNEYLFTVEIEDKVGSTVRLDNKFQIVAFPFKKEVLTVAHDKVTEEKSLGRDGKELEVEIEQLIAQSPHEKLWKGSFCTPIEIERVTCEYGTIRTTQHKGRYAHKAIDVINTPKSVVWAPQEGTVIIKDRFGPSGNTVVLDHGLGVFSLFYHLDNFADVEIGQKVCQGNPIGTIGKTGFATGYHLHWEMRINNIPVDPLQWTKITL
jgi:hypothetical protein